MRNARPTLSILMQREADRIEHELLLLPAEPWSKEESTDERRLARVRAAIDSYWSWDGTYITPELYPEGYAKPGDLAREIIDAIGTPGIHWFYAFRKGGKSVTAKKGIAHALLTGRLTTGGTLSDDLLKSKRILRHIKQIIFDNPRIVADFNLTLMKDNADELMFRVHLPGRRPHTCYVSAFSEERSARGFSEMFGRPQFFIGDDLENRRSPIGEQHAERRRHTVTETTSSGTDDCVFIGLGNIFAEGTLGHTLKTEKELGMLDDGWNVTIWPAWTDERGSGWPERYPAKSENEMRSMLRMPNDVEWAGDGQQEPKKPDGNTFPRAQLCFWSEVPVDARGVVWVDPNLSLKEQGDTTAIIAVLFSPTTWLYYVVGVRCKSFSDSDDLLDAVLAIWSDPRVFVIGFDGNVGQESTWTNNIRHWSRRNKRPFPHVEFRRYRVDLLAKNVEGAWKASRILFKEGVTLTPEGKRAIDQIVTFVGKKKGRKDDAPDALISAFELLHELGMAWPVYDDESSTSDLTIIEGFTPY